MNEENKRKRGRPKGYRSADPKNKSLPKVMVTEGQLTAYKAASENLGMTFSAWVRSVLDKASG